MNTLIIGNKYNYFCTKKLNMLLENPVRIFISSMLELFRKNF